MAVNMIDNKQKKAIWTAAKENGLEKEDIYSVIYNISKKEHMTELTYVEAAKVLDKINNRKYGNTGASGKISDNQMGMIKDLATSLGWNDVRINGFIKSRYKIEHIKWLSARQASSCIEALKSMIKRTGMEANNGGKEKI
ncbi:MAG: phage protein GemA/Gp16 family protein [Anaerovorax sp.]|nr:phage protein GemA/Gp16 family protein [Anaerovorax sp.]